MDGAHQASAWEGILPHQDRLLRLVRRRIPNSQDAEDCVQEIMLRAATHRNLEGNRVGPFLTAVAVRLCVDFYREADRRRRLLQRAPGPQQPESPEEGVCDRDFGRWLLEQARLLRGREQQVILARADGVSTAEFARMHQISIKAAEGAFTRGRARLRMACAKVLE